MGQRTKRKPSPVSETDPDLAAQEETVLDMTVADPEKDPVVDIKHDGVMDQDLIRASLQNIRTLADAGTCIEQLGSLRIANGMVLVTQESCVALIERNRRNMQEGKGDVIQQSKAVASLGNTLAKLTKEFRVQNESSKQKPQAVRTLPAPGTKITYERTTEKATVQNT